MALVVGITTPNTERCSISTQAFGYITGPDRAHPLGAQTRLYAPAVASPPARRDVPRSLGQTHDGAAGPVRVGGSKSARAEGLLDMRAGHVRSESRRVRL